MAVDCDVSLGVDLTGDWSVSFKANFERECSMSSNKVINTKKRGKVLPVFGIASPQARHIRFI